MKRFRSFEQALRGLMRIRAPGGGAGSIAASSSPITPTGRASCGRSGRRARSACLPPSSREALVRHLRETEGVDAAPSAATTPDPEAIECAGSPPLRRARCDDLHKRQGAAMQAYFAQAPRGRRVGSISSPATAEAADRAAAPRVWGCERAGVPGGSSRVVRRGGGWRKTIALLWTPSARGGRPARAASFSRLIEERLLPLRDAPEEEKHRNVLASGGAGRREIFLLDKLLTGSCAWASPRPWPSRPACRSPTRHRRAPADGRLAAVRAAFAPCRA